ncbi:MAG: NAD(P)(+) transhydrogenase (Re/Si-specific) subunit beta, partial [Nocardioidaceae bacterium]
MIETWAHLGYLVAAVCFIVALKALSSPRTARAGNLLGAAGAVLAVVVTFLAYKPDNLIPILVAITVGSVGGVVGSRRVQMTHMPQLVALFNGVGGGSAALVALMELGDVSPADEVAAIATAFTV